jgi:hypothetical protein
LSPSLVPCPFQRFHPLRQLSQQAQGIGQFRKCRFYAQPLGMRASGIAAPLALRRGVAYQPRFGGKAHFIADVPMVSDPDLPAHQHPVAYLDAPCQPDLPRQKAMGA